MDMDGINNLVERERDLYGLAYKKGLSVAFICRTLAFDNWERVYKVLRQQRLVPLLPTRQRYTIPAILDGTFRKVKHSFPKWCASYGFDLQKAANAVNAGPYDAKDQYSQKVLAALKDDFHNLYLGLYESKNIFDMKFTDYDESTRSNYSCHINSIGPGHYEASIPEWPEMCAEGTCWDSALANLKTVFNTKRRIFKLEAMVKYGKEWKNHVKIGNVD